MKTRRSQVGFASNSSSVFTILIVVRYVSVLHVACNPFLRANPVKGSELPWEIVTLHACHIGLNLLQAGILSVCAMNDTVICTYPGCGRFFPYPSALHLHQRSCLHKKQEMKRALSGAKKGWSSRKKPRLPTATTGDSRGTEDVIFPFLLILVNIH